MALNEDCQIWYKTIYNIWLTKTFLFIFELYVIISLCVNYSGIGPSLWFDSSLKNKLMDLDSLVTIRVVYVVFTVLTLVWKVENYRSPASKSPTEQSPHICQSGEQIFWAFHNIDSCRKIFWRLWHFLGMINSSIVL